MSAFGAILSVLVTGLLIGGAARLVVPGPDPMPLWLTVLIGLAGSIVGGSIAATVFGASHAADTAGHAFATILLEIAAATALVAGYRHYVQRRPLTGADARRFPTRGYGIARIREQLRRRGIDPDKLRQPAARPPEPPGQHADEAARELAELEDLHDKGVLTDEQYEQAKQRIGSR